MASLSATLCTPNPSHPSVLGGGAQPGREELAWPSTFGNPTGWLSLNKYLGKRALEAPAFFHCLEVSLREAAPRQLLLSAAAWQDATRPRF